MTNALQIATKYAGLVAVREQISSARENLKLAKNAVIDTADHMGIAHTEQIKSVHVLELFFAEQLVELHTQINALRAELNGVGVSQPQMVRCVAKPFAGVTPGAYYEVLEVEKVFDYFAYWINDDVGSRRAVYIGEKGGFELVAVQS